ncbi:MAG: AMP-binding protein [Christensenellaceae bacterium]|jgi:acetyl-CoA synthetase|nr:AMP-binding protein [Christensenellaceae bacterium]
MLLSRFLAKTSFDSYDDYKKNFEILVPESFSYPRDVVDEWAKAEPAKRALAWLDDHGQRREFSFAEISSLSKKAASYLQNLGIKKGDMVLVQLKRHWEYWVTALALHRLGAVLIPASIQLTAKDIAYRAAIAGIRMVIACNEEWSLSQIEEALPQCQGLEFLALCRGSREGWLDYSTGIEAAGEEYAAPDLKNSDLLLSYFTSGTTGMPKMVMHDQTYPLGHIVTAKYWQQVENGGLHFTASDSGWAKFGWGCLYGQWIAGTAILGYDQDLKFNARNLINVLRQEKPTTVCVPPTIYRFIMREGLTREDFMSVRHCCTAGEPLAPEVNREFERLTGLPIHDGFGQSEGIVLVGNFAWFDSCPGSMGKPSPLYDIAIVDEEGRECPVGEEGEIVIRGLDRGLPPGLTIGYYSDGRVSRHYAAVYHTGDVAWMDESGFYWYVGRNDDVIKCSGYRIGPFEIESVLLTHPAVLECAITAAADPIRGQVVCATIVLSPGHEGTPALTKEIQDYVKKLTAPYKYPRVVRYIDALPKTTSGKIIRAQIRSSMDQ